MGRGQTLPARSLWRIPRRLRHGAYSHLTPLKAAIRTEGRQVSDVRPTRSVRIDAMRGFAMMCVVMNHAIQRNIGPQAPVFGVIAAFEMPLFAFVTGYLTRVPAHARGQWVRTRAQRVLIPFIAWVPILWAMSHFAFSGLSVVHIPPSFTQYLRLVIIQPRTGLWYLAVVFYWYVIAAIANAVGPWFFAVAFVGVWFGRAPLTAAVGEFALGYLIDLFPYFLAGHLLRGRKDLDARASAAPAVLALLGFGALYAALASGWLLRLVHIGFLAQTLVGAAGVTAAVLAIKNLPESKLMRGLALVGQYSLGIYAAHLLFLRTGPSAASLKGLSSFIPALGTAHGIGWTQTMVSFVVALVFAMAITWVLKRWKLTAAIFLGERPAVPRTT